MGRKKCAHLPIFFVEKNKFVCKKRHFLISADVPSSDPSGNNNSARRRIVSADDEVFKRTTRKKSSNIMETSVRCENEGL